MRIRMCLAILVAGTGSGFMATTASAYTANFGCQTGGRAAAATANYTAPSATQWTVSSIDYSYSNSGGGHTNTNFQLWNGANVLAWTYGTPDDRRNQAYNVKVNRTIARGSSARVWQKTWFDTFGPDPSCSQSARL